MRWDKSAFCTAVPISFSTQEELEKKKQCHEINGLDIDGLYIVPSMYSGPGDIVGCNMTSHGSRPGNHCKSRVSLLCKISSQVHIIAWQDLLRVMRVYPEIRTRIMEQMVLSFELDSQDMVSDLRVTRTT